MCGKEVKDTPNGIAMRAHMRVHTGAGRTEPTPDISGGSAEPVSPLDNGPAADPFGGPAAEPAPTEPKRGWKLWGSKTEETKPERPTKETKPAQPRGRRVDAARMLGDGWGAVGRAIERRFPAYLPAARALQAEAFAAGPIVSELVRGTLADRPVQFAARHYEAGSVALSLLALPAFVQIGGQELLSNGVISPQTHRRIEDCIVDLAPSMVKWAKREQKRRQDVETSLEELREVLGIPANEPVSMSHLFGFFYPVAEPSTIPAQAHVA